MPQGGYDEDRSSALLRHYVHTALCAKADGCEATSYCNLVTEIKSQRRQVERDAAPGSTSHQLLVSILMAVRDNAASVRERIHDTLLDEVLSIPLWTVARAVRHGVLDLIGHLVLADSAFMHTGLQLLVYNLTPPPGLMTAAPTGRTAGLPWVCPAAAAEVQPDILACLERLLPCVPTAAPKMVQLVAAGMPHKLRCRDDQCLYLSTVYALAERPACVTLRDGILAAAVEHLLSLDVEIRWQDIADVAADERDEMGSTDDDEDIFELEGMSDLDICDGGDAAGGAYGSSCAEAGFGGIGRVAAAAAAEASTSGRRATDEIADTLDSLMELTFEHLTRRHAMGHASEVWACLLSTFERLVLPTARCKFTQFLVFGSAALGPPCRSESLVALLLSRATSSTGVPDVARCIAAAYLGSFLARAAFVPSGTVLSALTQLLAFCYKYASTAAAAPAAASTPRASTTPAGLTPRLSVGGAAAWAGASPHVLQPAQKPHAVFYACVQAAMYVLCYRLCADTAAGAAQLIKSSLLPLLLGPLDPLRHVLPSVSAEFAHQVSSAHGLDTATAAELVATAVAAAAAARSGSAVASTAGMASGISGGRPCRPLDVFFPFDPYLLRRSARYLSLRETYISWRHGHPLLRHTARPAADAAASLLAASLSGSGGGDARPPHRHGDDDDGEGEGDQDGGGSMAGGVGGDSLDGASADDGTSASGSSGDELEGMSLRSGDHHLLTRPGQRGAGHGHAPVRRPPLAPGAAPAHTPALARLQRNGGSSAGVAKRMRMPLGVSPDDGMTLSCSPGGMSPVDTTPMGASPVLVSYMGPPAGSPMQMTPVVDGGHMEWHVGMLQRALRR